MSGPAVVIGVPCAEQGRWSVFWEALEGLKRPPDMPPVLICRGPSVAENRNLIVTRAQALNAERIFFLDDDQLFGPDVLMRLLAHDVDVVVGLSLMREPPFDPLIYLDMDVSGTCKRHTLGPFDVGLRKVVASTSGGLLIKTSVFEKLQKPYWTLGQIKADIWGDDLWFCKQLRDAGIPMYCDTDTPFGHLSSCAMWPMRDASGNWVTCLMKNGVAVQLPNRQR